MARLGRPGLSDMQRRELWDRWKAGDSISDIGRALFKHPGSVHGVLALGGGIYRPEPKRAASALTTHEREQISRGLAAGHSCRQIAADLDRAPSTVSREVHRNGGAGLYRAMTAEERAKEQARRPQRCALARSPEWLGWCRRSLLCSGRHNRSRAGCDENTRYFLHAGVARDDLSQSSFKPEGC